MGQRRQTATAGVRLWRQSNEFPALRGGQPNDLASNRGGCDQISLLRASMRRENHAQQPGNLGNVGLNVWETNHATTNFAEPNARCLFHWEHCNSPSKRLS